jgi:hypothetical protein
MRTTSCEQRKRDQRKKARASGQVRPWMAPQATGQVGSRQHFPIQSKRDLERSSCPCVANTVASQSSCPVFTGHGCPSTLCSPSSPRLQISQKQLSRGVGSRQRTGAGGSRGGDSLGQWPHVNHTAADTLDIDICPKHPALAMGARAITYNSIALILEQAAGDVPDDGFHTHDLPKHACTCTDIPIFVARPKEYAQCPCRCMQWHLLGQASAQG